MPPLEEEKISGERFAKERERLGLSQQKFGELVGLQQAGVNAVEKEYRTESGTLRSTSVEKFIRSAKVFNCISCCRTPRPDAPFYNMKCPPFFYSRFSILDIDKSLNSAIINIIRY